MSTVADRTISSVTVGGITATSVIQISNNNGTFFQRSAIYVAVVPTGTTADIVVTWSAGQLCTGIATWAAYDLRRGVADTTATSTASTGTASISVPGGGFAILYLGSTTNAAARTYTWTNGTERFDQTIEGGVIQTGADNTHQATSATTYTATPNAASDTSGALFASFR